MIADCHSYLWTDRAQLGSLPPAARELAADAVSHHAAHVGLEVSFVLGVRSLAHRAHVPAELIASYTKAAPGRRFGFAGVDPVDEREALEAVVKAAELQLAGVCVNPALQGYHPTDSRAMAVFAECSRRGLIVIVESPGPWGARRLEFGRPALMDEVALEFPELRLILARMGHPWWAETLLLLANRSNVWADISGLSATPWTAYTALVSACEHGVVSRLLFGSDFPFHEPKAVLETLFALPGMVSNTQLPTIPREHLRGIVERDVIKALGLPKAEGDRAHESTEEAE